MPWVAAIPAIIGGISAISGNEAKRKEGERAENMANATRDMLQGIALPDIEKQKLLLELQQSVGDYNPNLESAIAQGPSAMEGVSTDPNLALAQMQALESLQGLGETGMTAAEMAQLKAMRREVGQGEQSRQAAILQDMARRGAAGGGLELAAKLKSSQAAADRASQESDRIAAMAQNRALQAISQAGTLGGTIRGQEFGEKSSVAKAKDIINQFNTANQQSVQQRNVGNQNIAAQQNLQKNQAIANINVDARNKQQQYNKALDQQRFDNELRRATGTAQANTNLQNIYQQQANDTGQMHAQIGTGAAQLAGSLLAPKSAVEEAEDEI